MPTIKINDAEFYYELRGTGQPVVLIAGYTCDSQVFITIPAELSKHYQVLLIDNRAIGRTKDDGRALTVELMADDVMTIINNLKLVKPHLVGHSMGGTIAQCIASQYPDKIGKLVLLATTAKWREAMLRGGQSILDLRQKNLDFDTIFNAILAWVFGQKFLSSSKCVAVLKAAFQTNPHPQSLVDQERQYAALKKWDGREQLAKITAPTLVVYGTQDLISLPYESNYLVEHISNAKSAEIDCAHGFFGEEPEAILKALLDFFSK